MFYVVIVLGCYLCFGEIDVRYILGGKFWISLFISCSLSLEFLV